MPVISAKLQLTGSGAIKILILTVMIALPTNTIFPSLVAYLDSMLVNARFRAAPRSASEDIVYIAIDKSSLDSIGVWPWPRGVYAAIIARLSKADVGDVFIDVDFSAASTEIEDEKLEKALHDFGGGVILPAFRQTANAQTSSPVVVTQPLSRFRESSWLASANVALDLGMVRNFDLGDDLEGTLTQSVAAVLARQDSTEGTYPIDFSIDPATVPTYSFKDVLDGKVAAAELGGKSAVIGAHAIELKDIYPVPIYGALTGPLIHILAAETLIQDRRLRSTDQALWEFLLVLGVVAAVLALNKRSIAVISVATLVIVLAGEAAAFLLQKNSNIVIYTAAPWIILCLGWLLLLLRKIDFESLIARRATADQRTTRTLLEQVIAESTDAVVIFDESLQVRDRSASAVLIFSDMSVGADLNNCLPLELSKLLGQLVLDYTLTPGSTLSSSSSFRLDGDAGLRYFEATMTVSPSHGFSDLGAMQANSYVGSLIARDTTAQREYQEKLRHIAQHDPLTGLLNAREFSKRLKQLGEGQKVVAAIGLHRFLELSVVLGRDVSDELLMVVAGRLKGFNAISLAARLESGIFLVAFEKAGTDMGQDYADSLLSLFSEQFEVSGSSFQIDARVGIFISNDGLTDLDKAIGNAEAALHVAKSTIGESWSIFRIERDLEQQRARMLEHAMRKGLLCGEFYLSFQPQVSLDDARLVGAEALLRWEHPDLGIVSPGEFIPIAETSGFINELGIWALNEACQAAIAWPDELSIAVNVSALQFLQSDVVADVRQALERSGLCPKRLHLEITESSFIDGTAKIVPTIKKLRAMGVLIALDDFGTGYSSLSYMSDFPLDKLKIDQSFVRKMTRDANSFKIIQAVALLAHNLGLKIVAEGIETEQEWKILAELDCEEGQGYFFGRPQSAADFSASLSKQAIEVRQYL